MFARARQAFVLLALAGCGSDADTHADAAPPPDAQELTHIVQGTLAAPDLTPLPDVEICVRERPAIDCVTSDATGFYRFFIPQAEVSVTYTLAGRERMLLPLQAQSSGVAASLLVQESAAIDPAMAGVGLTFPATPIVTVNVFAAQPSDRAGATVTISVPADGPIYSAPGGFLELDPTLTATSEIGLAVFGNLAEGDVEITVEHPTLSCALTLGGWPTALPNRARAPAVNGFDTVVAFHCQ